MKKRTMKTLSLKLSPALRAKLEALAKRRKTSRSAILREALDQYMSNGARLQGLTCLELAGDLIGSVDSDVSDLATNPKYMEGYGR